MLVQSGLNANVKLHFFPIRAFLFASAISHAKDQLTLALLGPCPSRGALVNGVGLMSQGLNTYNNLITLGETGDI